MIERTNRKIDMYMPFIEQQLKNGVMLKDIASKLNITCVSIILYVSFVAKKRK